MRHVVVIGAGIGGLTAARRLAAAGRRVTVLEAAPQIGGKLRLAEVGGVQVDVGAEAMLNRRPEATGLARELGFDLVHPGTLSSRLWTRDSLRVLPRSVMGIPADLDQLAETGVLSAAGLERVRHEQQVALDDGDVSVADFVGSRLGPEVVDRLVEPLLGGVYAGHAALLSARATIPQVVGLLDRSPSLLEAASASPKPSEVPVFAGLAGGIGQLPQRLASVGGFDVRTSSTVRELRRVVSTDRPRSLRYTRSSPAGTQDIASAWPTTEIAPVVEERGTSALRDGSSLASSGTVSKPPSTDPATHFELVVGPTTAPEIITADEVVLAIPAAPAARLLDALAPGASAALREIEYASMAIVTLAFRAADLAGLEGSGFLVPPVDGRRIKASTFSFNKWDWVREAGRADDVLLLRTSIGRHREEASLQFADEELVAQSLDDLALATGIRATPVDAHVQRWGGALPQYAVGHLDRVRRVRDAVAQVPGLVVCGAAYDGIGIPAVVASAQRAVADLGVGG